MPFLWGTRRSKSEACSNLSIPWKRDIFEIWETLIFSGLKDRPFEISLVYPVYLRNYILNYRVQLCACYQMEWLEYETGQFSRPWLKFLGENLQQNFDFQTSTLRGLVLTERPLNSNRNREQMVELALEKLEAGAVSIQDQV